MIRQATIQPWRGYINTLTDDLDLTRSPDDRMVTTLVDDLIEQRIFNGPVEDFYRAAVTAVTSQDDLAIHEYTSDAIVRDLLRRAIALLDKRRPWPEPPFYSLDARRWPQLLGDTAPLIGRIALSRRHLGERVNRSFTRVTTPPDPRRADTDEIAGRRTLGEPDAPTHTTGPGPHGVDILILRLRGGHLVGLKAYPLNPQQGIDVHANNDPDVIIEALRELAGLDVEPAASTGHG